MHVCDSSRLSLVHACIMNGALTFTHLCVDSTAAAELY